MKCNEATGVTNHELFPVIQLLVDLRWIIWLLVFKNAIELFDQAESRIEIIKLRKASKGEIFITNRDQVISFIIQLPQIKGV